MTQNFFSNVYMEVTQEYEYCCCVISSDLMKTKFYIASTYQENEKGSNINLH